MIATSAKVDLEGVDEKALDKVSGKDYFVREKTKEKKDGEQFFKQGEKMEVRNRRYSRPAE